MSSIININNLVKNYFVGTQTVYALRSISVNINKNEYVAIMGPSGSGKSTLMNILGGVFPYDEGQITLGGQPYIPTSPREATEHGVAFSRNLWTISRLISRARSCRHRQPRPAVPVES